MKHKVLVHSPLSIFSSLLLIGSLAACPAPTDDNGGFVEEDLIPPAAPSLIEAQQLDRITSSVSWVAPADDDGSPVVAYEMRYARDPLGDNAFGDWGDPLTPPAPSAPGEIDQFLHTDLPGYGFYLGIVAQDAAGNRSEVAEGGPFYLELDIGEAVRAPSPDDDDNGFGYQLVTGDFDGDQYLDLAISAPFKRVVEAQGVGTVYVYFGSPAGFADVPDLEIVGTESSAQFGNSLAVLDWNDDNVDDLAIGAPFGAGFTGQAYIFHGQAIAAGGSLLDTDADTTISVDPNSGWFAGSVFSWALAAGNFDGDGRDDLAVSSVFADLGVGAIVILHGGTSAGGDVTLSEVDPVLMDGQVASVIFAPGEVQGGSALFGSIMHNLGRPGPGQPDQIGTAFFQGPDMFVLRGRQGVPADPGVHEVAFDPAVDLRATIDVLDPETFFAFSQGAIMDIDGDGAREIAVGSYREGMDAGMVALISGVAVGEQPLADITVGSVVGAEGQLFGSAVASHSRGRGTTDFDGDGTLDLIIAGGTTPGSPGVSLHVWFNDGYHDFTEILTADTADVLLVGPEPDFVGTPPTNGGTPINARSIGDFNSDGFGDIVWADWTGNNRDGSFVLIR